MAFRIKQLLYDEMFTIAGAKKKLQTEMREAPKLKVVQPSEPRPEESYNGGPGLFEDDLVLEEPELAPVHSETISPERKEAVRMLASQLLELREMLKTSHRREAEDRLRK